MWPSTGKSDAARGWAANFLSCYVRLKYINFLLIPKLASALVPEQLYSSLKSQRSKSKHGEKGKTVIIIVCGWALTRV